MSSSPRQFVTTETKPNQFTVGSTKAEVAAAQGPPDRIEGDTWYYGKSQYSYQHSAVSFEYDRVVRWDSKTWTPLRVWMATPQRSSVDKDVFTVGSTKAEVAAAQGPPDRIEGDTWYYGKSQYSYQHSAVSFEYDRVVRWDSKTWTPLRVGANQQ